MTYIPGIEGLHAWTPPGASEPAVVLGEAPYLLKGIVGLESLGDSEDNSDLKVGAVGENDRRSERRGKTVVYEGRIVADPDSSTPLLDMREAAAALRAAFADLTTLGRMDMSAHPDNVELAGTTPKFLEARALNVDIPDQQATKQFERPFVIGLRMKDPRVFEEAAVVHSVETTETSKEVMW